MANETKIIELAELDEIERSEDLATIREKTQEIARQIQQILLERGQMMATAESLTGGLVASHIVDIAGSSAVFAGGIVAYQNEIKEALLGVPHAVLEEKGAVSAETVLNMTEGARKKFGCQWAIATSGIAGPGGAEPGKPVGTVTAHEDIPGNPCIWVETGHGEVLVPLHEELVLEVDEEKETLRMEIPEGLLDL